MKKTKVIVTGGTGYIGSHTVVELLQQDFEVAIIDNLCNSEREVLQWIEQITGILPDFTQGDLKENAICREFFEHHRDAEAVIHFAALKAVGESVQMPLEYYENNIASTLGLLNHMIRFEIPKIIFSSSATVYGKYETLPLTEQSPIFFPTTSPYGITKQINEQIIKDSIGARNALQAGISLRYFNPVGAHSSGLLGELPQGIPNNLMPFITQTAAGVREKLMVFGDDYETPDGTAIRDYIHIEDLAIAHVMALGRLVNQQYKQPYEIFNLGTGKGSSVMEVIKSFEKTTGKKLNYQITARRAGDADCFYADAAKAHLELGWKAKYNLDDMTASAWKWEQYYREQILNNKI